MNKKGTAQEDGKEHEIQAILFADSFQTKFLPISSDLPKVLMPLAGIPMIDYTIRFLRYNQVKEIFIFTAQNKKMIEDYFKSFRISGAKIKVISGETCRSVGEALREIHVKGVIHNDFVLIFGDIVANFDLSQALKDHARRKKEDKMNIVTKILKKISINHPLRTEYDDCMIVLDSNSNQILQYRNTSKENHIDLNLEKINFKKHRNNIQIRYDLIDTDITICSQDVLNIMAEHFDYNDFRDDFIHSVLTSEIADDKIHAYILKESEYAGRILDFRTYGFISQQTISRWLSPITLSVHDLKLKEKNTMNYSDFNTYMDDKLEISYSSHISDGCVVGRETVVKDGSKIHKSIIGKNCKIGENVKIIDSIIWDNVEIGKDTVIEKSIIADRVKIGPKCVINSGCVISFEVQVLEGVTIPSKTLVSTKGSIKSKPEWFANAGIYEDKEFKLTDSEFMGSRPDYFEQAKNFVNIQDNESVSAELEDFEKDLEELMLDAIAKKDSPEATSIELEGMRLSHNASFSECIRVCIPILFAELAKKETNSVNEFVSELKKLFTHWLPFLKKIIKGGQDEQTLIAETETFCSSDEKFGKSFHLFLQLFYQLEILSSESILDWAKNEENLSENFKKFLELSKKFIEYLESQDDEEEEEEEDDDEDEN